MPLPPNWADDAFSGHMDKAIHRAYATFDRQGPEYEWLACIDRSFSTIHDNLPHDNISKISCRLSKVGGNLLKLQVSWPDIFLTRAYAGYRAACQLAMSGQITESNAILRMCLEYSLYALHINTNSTDRKKWNNQYGDNLSSKSISRKFPMKVLKRTLKKTEKKDSKLLPFVSTLQEKAITFGVHPNRNAVDFNLNIIQPDAQLQSDEHYKTDAILFHTSPLYTGAGMLFAANIGIACLLVFEHIFRDLFGKFQIFPELFKCLEKDMTLEEFKQNLPETPEAISKNCP